MLDIGSDRPGRDVCLERDARVRVAELFARGVEANVRARPAFRRYGAGCAAWSRPDCRGRRRQRGAECGCCSATASIRCERRRRDLRPRALVRTRDTAASTVCVACVRSSRAALIPRPRTSLHRSLSPSPQASVPLDARKARFSGITAPGSPFQPSRFPPEAGEMSRLLSGGRNSPNNIRSSMAKISTRSRPFTTRPGSSPKRCRTALRADRRSHRVVRLKLADAAVILRS